MTYADTVVVGGGAAGCLLAAALSADPQRQVLVLEAGPDYRAGDTPPEIRGPSFGAALRLGRYHWTNLSARPHAGRPAKPYLQGRGIGGSSAINAQGAVRPLPADLDSWARSGCPGWTWPEVLPDLIALEDDADFADRPWHGRGGPVPVERSSVDAGPVSLALYEAAVRRGLPEAPDINAPDAVGVSPAAWHRRAGQRVTSNDSFLERARGRSNLRVRGEAPVAAIRCSRGRVRAVVVAGPAGAEVIETEQVLVCAGALHTPAILLHSGIGPAPELRRLGIDVVADLPGVGRGLQDHPMLWLTLPLRPGALASGGGLPGHAIVRMAVDDIRAGLEILALDRSTTGPADGGLMVALMRPQSRGRVSLVSADPGAPPQIDLGLLEAPLDRARLGSGLREAAELCAGAELRGVIDGAVQLGGRDLATVDLSSHAELADVARQACVEYFHVSGTCRMGSESDPSAVVTPDAAVIGVDGLYVVDASIFPQVPRSPTYLATLAAARHVVRHLVGSQPVGSRPVGSRPVGSQPVGSPPVGSQRVGAPGGEPRG